MWLEDALAPSELRKTGEARFDVRTITLDQLAAEPLDEYAAVCLLDPTPIANAAWYKLRDFVNYGGSLTLWLGKNAADTEKFNTAAALEVLPQQRSYAKPAPPATCISPRQTSSTRCYAAFDRRPAPYRGQSFQYLSIGSSMI